MITPTNLNITDDSGFLAVANVDKYNSFVSEAWELPQLLGHFVDEMNENTVIVWATGFENEWTIDVLESPSDKKSYREFTQSIEVTNGKLFLTNYEDLTMAAQFVGRLRNIALAICRVSLIALAFFT